MKALEPDLQWTYESPIGLFYLIASDLGLRALYTRPPRNEVEKLESLNGRRPAVQILAKTVLELQEYFAGERTNFTIPLDVEGTDFQKKVWEQLKQIPFGQTRSYGDIAKSLDKHKAMRAVGSANGKNPVSVIVPCHRVIAADGTLGGYSGGLPMKVQLLELEKAVFKPNRKR